MYNFEATKDFIENIHDMKFMLEDIKKFEKRDSNNFDSIKSKILSNALFILTMSSYENFIEKIFENFVNKLNDLKIKLPDKYYEQHIKTLICKEKIEEKTEIKVDKIISKIYEYINIDLIDKITLNHKFSFGRHGSNELNKLFKRLGIEDLCSKITIYSYRKDIIGNLNKDKINFKAKFDEMTSKRNNVLHEYSMPPLTSQEITEYIRILGVFSRKLDILLHNELHILNTPPPT